MDDILHRAEQYQNLSIKKSQAHIRAADIFSRRNVRLGAPVAVVTSIVATSCDAVTRTLAKCARRCPTKYSFAVGHGRSLDRSSCPLRVETFLRYSELASQHHRTGVAYESVRRQLDLFGLQFRASNDRDAALKALAEISAKLDAIADAEPTVPQRMYDRIQYTPADDSEFAKLPGKTSSQ
jgi:hypothetical protein